ncbi:carboxypeptidase-like regulatory domain-containing protein [Acidipila sp. EB88]|uniref:carboxypeptidase-like regulatory domain-containing protein n=1 Tax=Acidipila sp. EB88 TaxID=2305226 RepID=UPI000F5E2F6E|nr:carboxypeptidase-like regulatory domain-containing protein [Acidipila sp. EB88]
MRETTTNHPELWARAARSSALLLCSFVMAGLFVSAIATPSASAQVQAKVLEGKVLDAGTAPLPGGIVYLQDQKTNVVKTFIATADGSYRFGQLPADTDYKIWAEYKGEKSKAKLISSFDTKMNVTVDFHIAK